MKIAFASFLAMAALATMAGCVNHDDDASSDDLGSDASEVVGVTDLTEMEAAFGLEKDVKLPNGKWSRGDAQLKAGACWQARFGAGAAHPENWELRRYKTGAAFFRKLGVGPLEGDERAVRCVDIDAGFGGQKETFSLEGLSLDTAFRMKLGKLGGSEGAAGHLYLDFSRVSIEVQDADHLCGFYDLTGNEKSIDPALKAGTTALNACSAAHGTSCDTKSYDACKTAFAADTKGDGSIDRPAFRGLRFVGLTDTSLEPSVEALVYRYAMKTDTDARKFSMAADPVGEYKSHKTVGIDEIAIYEKLAVHHLKLNGQVEAMYVTGATEITDPTAHAKATCTRKLDAKGEPTTAYACTGI